jgi:hypothetical protein
MGEGVVLAAETRPDRAFKWQDRTGGMHAPERMETRHVFFTLRMIWNHSAPERLKLKPFRRYTSFGAHYSPDYMHRAVRALIAEASRRDDLRPEWAAELRWMVERAAEFTTTRMIEEGGGYASRTEARGVREDDSPRSPAVSRRQDG